MGRVASELWYPPFTPAGYERLLVLLIRHGYQIRPVEDMATRAGDGSRVVFLRHDIDAHLTGITRLAEIEEGLGVRSTWMVATRLHYNPGYRPNREIIRRLHGKGHRIGVHYLNGELVQTDAALCHLIGLEPTSCAAHQPASIPPPPADFIQHELIHPHHPDFDVIPYISDSRREWRDDEIAKLAAGDGPQQAHLNLHPEHWLGHPGETRHQAAARITAAMLADTQAAAREIRDGWNLP